MTSFYGESRNNEIISDEEENRVSRANIDKWIFRILLVVIGFMPLVVLGHTQEVISPLISNILNISTGIKGDIFTNFKTLILITLTVISGILLLTKVFFMNGQIKKTKVNLILGVFVIAIIVSTIFSPNISIALNGQYNRSDGALSWLCYIALMFIALNIDYPKKFVNYVMYSLIPFVFINLYIITMNFTGNDLMQNTWVQNVVGSLLPEGVELTEGSLLVGTLNQWNYMSGMFAIMTVMYLTWGIIEKIWINHIISIVAATASMSIVFMSISTSGFITVLLLIPLLIFIFFKVNNKRQSFFVIILFLLLSTMVLHILAKENPRVWDESFGFIFNNNPYVKAEEGEVTFFNFNNKVSASDNSFELPVLPESGVSAGTGRVYIWEKTFDLIKDRPLIGYGMDSLMYNFPHYNIDARAGLGTETIITDKPHNIFIGILYGTGIFGFIAIVLLFVYFIYSFFKHLFKKVNIQYVVLGIGSLAYFTQGMFNDSLPSVSAVSWIFMGIMFATYLKEKELED